MPARGAGGAARGEPRAAPLYLPGISPISPLYLVQASPALLDALFQAAVALRPLPFRHGVAKVMHFAQAVILGFGLGLKLGLEP